MSDTELHLPDLLIKGFRGIGSISIPRLGRVTLLAGRNGVGKTTVLDAIRLYASRGYRGVLHELLSDREELLTMVGEDHDPIQAPNFSALFHGGDIGEYAPIVIGPSVAKHQLQLREYPSAEWTKHEQLSLPGLSLDEDADARALAVQFRKKRLLHPWNVDSRRGSLKWSFSQRRELIEKDWPPRITCETIGPGLISNRRLAGYWDSVALTEAEDYATEALKLVLGDNVERIAVVGDDLARTTRGRRVVVKIEERPQPAPLKSLGDGAGRLLGIALALANSRGGFLLIDEAENGIHFSVQVRLWKMVFRIARQHNIQVLATTHSFDCVRGFAQAALDDQDSEGILIRLETDGDTLQPISYTEEGLKAAADQGIEVR